MSTIIEIPPKQPETRPQKIADFPLAYTGTGYKYVFAMNEQVREKVLARVKRVAGQVAGVQRMIEQDRYCVDILHQISAVRSALDALGVELLTNHLETCVFGSDKDTKHPAAKAMKPEALLAEVRNVVSRFLR